MGVAVSLTNSYFEREVFVVGMTVMPGNHCAEHIQEAIQNVFQRYDFDNSKVTGVCSDEGSAFVRLFKQRSNDLEDDAFLYIEDDPTEAVTLTNAVSIEEIQANEDLQELVAQTNNLTFNEHVTFIMNLMSPKMR